MKYTVILATLGTASALAVPRDLKAVQGALTTVQNDIDGLDSAVKSFNGNADPVVQASDKLIATIKKSDGDVGASGNLDLSGALGLTSSVSTLKNHAQTLANDLTSRKDAIQQAGQCDLTRQKITDINSASQDLISTVVSKVPAAAKGIAQKMAGGITDVLSKAQDSFSPENCRNA